MSSVRIVLLAFTSLLALLFSACSGERGDELGRDTDLDPSTLDGGGAIEEPPPELPEAGADLLDVPEVPNRAQLVVELAGDGEGRVVSASSELDCGSACETSVATGSTLSLTAEPAAGSRFVGFQGAACGAGTTCDLTVDGDLVITAEFALERHPVAVGYAGDGSGEALLDVVEGSPCAGDPCLYKFGTLLELTAVPGADSTFLGWNGAECGSEPLCSVRVEGALTLEAVFGRSDQGLTVSLSGNGDGVVRSAPEGVSCPGQCVGPFPFGSNVVLTAEPDLASSRFAGWSGACSGEEPTCQVLMQGSLAVEARFERLLRDLDVSVLGNGGGSVHAVRTGSDEAIIACGDSGDDCDASLPHGAEVELTATVPAFASFRWSGACDGETSLTCTLRMTEARNATLTTTLLPRGLTVSTTGNGAGLVRGVVQGSAAEVVRCGTGGTDCSETVSHGTNIVLTAQPSAGSSFVWSGACAGVSANVCTVAMTAARSVGATFSLLPRTLTVSTTGNGAGLVTGVVQGGTAEVVRCGTGGTDCSETVNHGTNIVLTAQPSTGSSFAWSGACTGVTANTCTVAMTDARAVSVAFTLLPRTLTVSTSGNGAGLVTGVVQGGTAEVVRCGTGGTDCSETVNHGVNLVLTVQPGTGSSFAWAGACAGVTANQCTVAMTTARSVSATFTLLPRTLTVSTTGNGAGLVTGVVQGTSAEVVRCGTGGTDCSETVNHGVNLVLTAQPSTGSSFAWAGACAGVTANVCTVAMTAARSVTMTFSLVPRTLTVGTDGNGAGLVTGVVQGGAAEVVRCGTGGTDCSETVNHGVNLVLTAQPSTGSSFAWSGACAGVTANVCTVAMTDARAVTARFALIMRTLSITVQGSGSGDVVAVTSAGQQVLTCASGSGTCTTTVAHGTTLQLTATPVDARLTWSGACSGTGTGCSLSMTADRAATLTLTRLVTLRVSFEGSGLGRIRSLTGTGTIDCVKSSATGAPTGRCNDLFDYGTSVTLTAEPRVPECTGESSTYDYLERYSPTVCRDTPTCDVSMTDNRSISATLQRSFCVD